MQTALELDSEVKNEFNIISELLQASVSKRGQVQSLWYENDYLFSCKLNSFTQKRFLALSLVLKVKVLEIAYWNVTEGS